MRKITVLNRKLHSDVPGGNFCQWKRLTGSVLKKSDGQIPSSPDDQIWAKCNSEATVLAVMFAGN